MESNVMTELTFELGLGKTVLSSSSSSDSCDFVH
jgi:hypothetical protein